MSPRSRDRRLALAGRATLVRFPGGDHVEAWKSAPVRRADAAHAWRSASRIGRDPDRVGSAGPRAGS